MRTKKVFGLVVLFLIVLSSLAYALTPLEQLKLQEKLNKLKTAYQFTDAQLKNALVLQTDSLGKDNVYIFIPQKNKQER